MPWMNRSRMGHFSDYKYINREAIHSLHNLFHTVTTSSILVSSLDVERLYEGVQGH